MTTQMLQGSPVSALDLKTLITTATSPLSVIVKEYGIVYVTSITRDKCSGCEEQKPLFRELANRLESAHHGKISFADVHIRYGEGNVRESEDAKRILGHGSYPTYMVHIKSRFGPLEHYRAAYPSMDELEKQTVSALELAEYYQKQGEANASQNNAI